MKSTNRMRLKKGLAVCSLAVLTMVGCQGPEQQTRPPAPAPQVSVVTVQPQPIMLTTELPGRTSAYRIAEIRPQVNGLIQKRLFTEGADVKAGQVLYQIDPASFEAALKNAEAALTRSRANLPAVQSRVDRYQELLAEKAVSQQDYDDATAALRQVEADIQVLAGHGGNRPHQPGLHAHHRAHLRAHRPLQCNRRGHRDRLSAGGPGDHPAAQSHLRGCAPVDHRTAAPETAPGRRPPQPGMQTPARKRSP